MSCGPDWFWLACFTRESKNCITGLITEISNGLRLSKLKSGTLKNLSNEIWRIMAFASMAAVAATATATARPSSITLLTRRRPRSIFVPLAFSSFSSSLKTRKLVLYSKPGCCLCDGLKEKLQAAFLLSGPHSLHDVDLQVSQLTILFVFLFTYWYLSHCELVRWGILQAILSGKELISTRYLCWLKYSLMALRLVFLFLNFHFSFTLTSVLVLQW